MSISTSKINWIAGILEGEGYFGLSHSNKYPRIVLVMTDLDIIIRARDLLDKSVKIIVVNRKQWKTAYKISINSQRAVEWMMTLYSLMGERRQSKIKEVLVGWQSQLGYNNSRDINSAKSRIVLNFIRLGFTKEQANEKYKEILTQKEETVN